jgi:hypothetical protein
MELQVKKEQKQKKDEEKEKSRVLSQKASKFNIPPYPPATVCKVKSYEVESNTKKQHEWLKKYVPNWDGQTWSIERAEKFRAEVKQKRNLSTP